jgi:hypothetical protein
VAEEVELILPAFFPIAAEGLAADANAAGGELLGDYAVGQMCNEALENLRLNVFGERFDLVAATVDLVRREVRGLF